MIAKAAIGTTPTLALAAVAKRWCMLQNQSDTDIYVAFEGSSGVTIDSGASPGFKIAAGSSVALSDDNHRGYPLADAIYAVHGSTGTKNLVIQYA